MVYCGDSRYSSSSEDRSSLSSHIEQEELASADRVFSDAGPLVLIVSFSSVVAFAVCRSSLAGSVGIAVP